MKRAGSKRPKSGLVKIGRASGRVKCYIRFRPLNEDEIEREDENAVEVSENKTELVLTDNRLGLDKNFQFDHVFSEETTNPQISNFISKPLVKAAINGFNGTVMAYGQTGSGKTYTLMSPDGVAATTIERCFRKIAAAKENIQYKVSMSYLQIYQEKIFDLLNNAAANKIDLTIREHPQKGIYVENLSEYVVRSHDEVDSLLQLGKKRLIFAETKMNRTSSRSHSVCILSIERSSRHSVQPVSPTKKHFDKKLHATLVSEGVDSPSSSTNRLSACFPDGESSDSEDDDALSKMIAFNDDVVLKGHLYICDLAGNERIKKTKAEGERLSEAQHINYSLLELGNVIQALAENAESGQHLHVPFRNSTLTRLLQESLGGNCKTSLVVCCSPSDYNSSETKSSLSFGSRAMKVRNTAYVNVEMDYKKLTDDLAKVLDSRDKEIEELKSSHQHQIALLKKEAEMAAELKFGDGLNEARNAYITLKNLLDSQASSHAETMSKLQAELSRENDSKLAVQAELDRRQHFPVERHNKTKCLLLAEVLSMQLFYTLQSRVDQPELVESLTDSQDFLTEAEETQEEILENVDNLIGVLGSYLNLTEKEFAEANNEDFNIEKEGFMDDESSALGLESLVVKIRKRLKILKDSVDGRTLRFLNSAIDRKDRPLMENMTDVYQILQNLLAARREATDSEFLANSKDAERCLSYVLLDKALLCCLVALDKYQSENKITELEITNTELVEELEIIRTQNKSLNNDNNRLISQLEIRRVEEEDILTTILPADNSKALEALMKHNAKLKLEIDHLRKGHGYKSHGHEEIGTDMEIAYLRQHVTKLTRENQKLEYMMKVMEERFIEGDLFRLSTPKIVDKRETSQRQVSKVKPQLQFAEITTTSTSPPPTTAVKDEPTAYHASNMEFKEQLLTNKVETQKTLKQLKVIKVDEKIEYLMSPLKVTSSSGTNPEPAEKENFGQLLDTAIESAEKVGLNTDRMINSSIEDLESVRRSIDAAKASNESLGKQCVALANDRKTLEALLADLEGTPWDKAPTSFNNAAEKDSGIEYITEVYRTTSKSERRSDDIRVQDINAYSCENETAMKNSFSQDVIDKQSQTDVSCVLNGDSDSDGLEDCAEEQELRENDVVQRLIKKYCTMKELVKHLESEIQMFKIRTTALETELKEWQHLKDENILLEEEVKELQGLKIYLESQLVEAGSELGDLADDNGGGSNLSKWKNYDNEEHGSLLDLSMDSRVSSSSLNLNSTPNYQTSYPSMSRSMMDLSQPPMYSSFGSLRSSRGSFGSLKMLKLEMEGQPSRIRDKLKSASLLLQHTGSLESQLKVTRQKCFRLEGEVCKLVKEKKELSDELDKRRAIATMEMVNMEAEAKATEEPTLKKKGRHSFRFKRGKEEKDRLKNELSLAKEQLSKLKSQLEMPNPTVSSESQQPLSRYPSLSENEKRREKELALTRERCIILAEELGASNKEKVKLEDDLQEALDNIDILSGEIKRLNRVEEQRDQLVTRVDELQEKLQKGTKTGEENAISQARNGKDLGKLKSEVNDLLQEKSKLEDSVTDLLWEKDRLNEMENIVKRLVEVEKEKTHPELTQDEFQDLDTAEEVIGLRTENKHLKRELENLNEHVSELESELERSCNASLTQVLSAVKDKSEKSPQSRMETGSRGAEGRTPGTETRASRRSRSTSKNKDTRAESKASVGKKSRSKVQTISYL